MPRLTAIRHGETDINKLVSAQQNDPLHQAFVRAYDQDPSAQKTQALAREIYQSMQVIIPDSDIPLSEYGQHQARSVGKRLGDRSELPDRVIVSPYTRTLDTLRLMTEAWPALAWVPTSEEPRLQEQDRGVLQDYKSWRVFNVLCPEEGALHRKLGRYAYRYPGGENLDDVQRRVGCWLDEDIVQYPDEHVLSIAHVGTLVAIRAHIEELTPDRILDIHRHETPANASVAVYAAAAGRLAFQSYEP